MFVPLLKGFIYANCNKIIAADNLFYQLVTLTNKNGMQVQLTDWGATILSILVPVANFVKQFAAVLSLNSAENQAFLGATIGRFANRINQGQFRLAAKTQKIVKIKIINTPCTVVSALTNAVGKLNISVHKQPFFLFSGW